MNKLKAITIRRRGDLIKTFIFFIYGQTLYQISHLKQQSVLNSSHKKKNKGLIQMFSGSRKLLLLVALPLVLTGCGSSYEWGWYILSPLSEGGRINLNFLLQGLFYTLSISLSAFLLAMLTGLFVALPGMAKRKSLRYFNRVYVECFRSVPVLVMILWIYYGLPLILGIELTAFAAAIIALALCESAFHAEIFRAGIQAVDKGQFEAADTLGLNYIQKMHQVVLPQAIRNMLPPLANQFVYMLKMSSLASVVGVQELTRRANELQVSEYRAMEIYSFLVLEYLLLVLFFSFLARRLEKKIE